MDLMNERLRLDAYTAFDGPRLVFYGKLDATFVGLSNVFRQISGTDLEIRLDLLPFVDSPGNLQILASRYDRATLDSVKAKLGNGFRKQGKSINLYVWKNSPEEWLHLSELVDELGRCDIPCHQYLTDLPTADAIVVISKGEYLIDGS